MRCLESIGIARSVRCIDASPNNLRRRPDGLSPIAGSVGALPDSAIRNVASPQPYFPVPSGQVRA